EILARQTSVAADHPALPGHFPGRPIIPGVVLLQLVETMLVQSGYQVRECTEAKFRAPVAPAVPISLEVEVDQNGVARFVATASGSTAMAGTFICAKAIPS